MIKEIKRDLPRAIKAFKPFRGSTQVFTELENIIEGDWEARLAQLRCNFVHGDLQPKNILKYRGKLALIDYDRGGFFYPLFDTASFAVQFSHVLLLDRYFHDQPPRREEIRKLRQLFLSEVRVGGVEFDERIFRLFKVIILFQGLAFSTGGFKKEVRGGRKHLLFGMFRKEVKGF